MPRSIVQIPDPILRKQTTPVTDFGPGLRALAEEMFAALEQAKGVGLAGPQIGELQRLFVMYIRAEDPRLTDDDPLKGRQLVLVNPELVDHNDEQEEGREACLSIPDYGGLVPRWQQIVVQAHDAWGSPVRYAVSGFAARVMQHELDHLEGILFLDRLTGEDKLYRLQPTPAEAETVAKTEVDVSHAADA